MEGYPSPLLHRHPHCLPLPSLPHPHPQACPHPHSPLNQHFNNSADTLCHILHLPALPPFLLFLFLFLILLLLPYLLFPLLLPLPLSVQVWSLQLCCIPSLLCSSHQKGSSKVNQNHPNRNHDHYPNPRIRLSVRVRVRVRPSRKDPKG